MISSIKLNVPKARRLCDRLNYSRAAHQVASGNAATSALSCRTVAGAF